MMVLAGPGSGKTLVITHRTKNLIEEYGIQPGNILVITFTKAAAREMKERFLKLMDGVAAPVTFGTFHAIYFQILKHAYGFTAANILREEQKNQILRELTGQLKLELDDEADFIRGVAGEIGVVKNDGLDPDTYVSLNCPEEVFRNLYHRYEKSLRSSRMLDFDDMLVFCRELFEKRQDILAAWQKKYRYILVDEFQDVNRVQYDVLRMLAAPENNLFIVGDDDQSIYRFRGARPEIMLNFTKDYPDAKTILLDTNYRSTSTIVEGALRVIEHNQSRYPKNIRAARGVGPAIEIQSFPGPSDEAAGMLRQITAYHEQGIPYREMAVLYRTNTQPRLLISRLLEYNIPFQSRDVVPNLYDHWIAKNIKSYIQLALGDRERGEFLQIMNRPKRYLSREAFDTPTVSFERLRDFYQDKNWMLERINRLETDLDMLSRMTPFSAIHYIRHGIGYEDYLGEYAEYRKLKKEELIDVLDELQEEAREWKTYEEWFSHIEEYTEELAAQMKNRERQAEGVNLATMHSSKGLEYQVVFLIDVNEGVSPYRKAVLEEELEEERRMFYVGMTRAKEHLHLYSVKEQFGKKREPSRFLGEYLLDMRAMVPGAEVTHVKYQDGIIQKVENGKAVIYFSKPGRTMTLDLAFCSSGQLLRLKPGTCAEEQSQV